MKKSILLLIVSLFVLPMMAHEFWLQPEKFMYQPGDNINIRFWVGEDFDGSNWAGNRDKVNSLQLHFDDLTDDLADQVADEKGDSLQLSIFDEGTAMVTFNSTNSFIQLDSAKFNAYLKEDGLQNILDYRASHQEMDSTGREFYQRSVKTLLQVGDKKSNISRTTNLPLDIIPLVNPYTLKDNDSLVVKLLFKKQLLSNQLVNVWRRIDGKTSKHEYHTNEKGLLSFTVATSGKWMVSAVQMIHLNNNPAASWQSYWGSCTWGYE
ncbi:MAG: DUF4198 domain-containing protein [Chitinophagaceae bacterium]